MMTNSAYDTRCKRLGIKNPEEIRKWYKQKVHKTAQVIKFYNERYKDILSSN